VIKSLAAAIGRYTILSLKQPSGYFKANS